MLTRSADDCAAWTVPLERAGAEVVAYPCIATERIDSPPLRQALARSAAAADWWIFTSARGVQAFVELAEPRTPRARVAVVGDATADAARTALGRVDHTGAGTAHLLAESLTARPDFAHGVKCLLALAENAGPVLEEELTAAGATCERFAVYRTIPLPALGPKEPLSELRADKVVFASPTAVTGFLNRVTVDADVGVFTIGPSTSAAARSHGLRVTAEARMPTLEGLLEAMHG